jgi:sugar O-acyltransferase (sialic acid O-acetyltransferase NeuD family)
MAGKTRNLVIVGDSAFAQVACEYFSVDSGYRVAGFAVERAYLNRDALCDLPVVAFEDVEGRFPPSTHDVFVAVTYTQLNRLRARLLSAARERGYRPARYVSSRAFAWRNAEIGEHCFVFEGNTLQPFCRVSDNVVLWSGNHVGHHSTVRSDCFVSSHCVLSGFVEVGAASFLGVNCTVANNVRVGRDNWVGPGVLLTKDTPDGALYAAEASPVSKVSSLRFCKVPA